MQMKKASDGQEKGEVGRETGRKRGGAERSSGGGEKKGKRAVAERVMAELEREFPEPEVPLAYRDAYTLLVAVLLSAQCTDERVNRTTPALWRLAGTVEAMAEVGEEAILEVVRPCGLGPRKAKAIRELSRELVASHGGEVPADLEALEALPGVGHKTAQVVMAQAFGVPSFPVDTHIHRLAQRWGLSSGKTVEQTERDLKRLFPRERWNRLHLQMIYYGRRFCTARTVCDGRAGCPLCPWINGWRKRPVKTRKG